jgi:hypothetical protein
MSLTKEQITSLDNLSDSEFIFWICDNYGAEVPRWERISKKEYEKHCGKNDGKLTLSKLKKISKNLFDGREFRVIPYYKNGGGILDQICLDKKPDGYYYERCTGYDKVLQLGGDLIEYCLTRECMKPFFFKELI